MELWEALLLGLVEGLTEYLPVSSTGHLLVTQRLLGIESSEAANAFAIVIQAGAIVAVLGLYRARVMAMLRGLVGRDPEGLKLALALVAAFVPAAAAGLLLGDTIKSVLFGTWPVVGAWIVGGVLLVAFGGRLRRVEGQVVLGRFDDPFAPVLGAARRPDRPMAYLLEYALHVLRRFGPPSDAEPSPVRHRQIRRAPLGLESLHWRSAFVVGLFQCLALWPGTSRSLAAIVGGVVVGLSLPAAVELSFLLGLVTLGAATAYESLQSGQVMLDAYGPAPLAVGFAAAWISAVVAVRFMVRSLQTYGLAIYGWWRITIGVAVGAWMLSGGNV